MDNNDDEDAYDVVEELPMETIISKENICYNQVLASVCADTNHTTTSTVTREKNKDNKTKFIIAIVVIVLVLSAICVCIIYTLSELSRFKSEIEQTMHDSLDALHHKINYLLGFHPTSCAAILLLNSSSPSGYYSIRSSNGSLVGVYCNMTLSCGGVTGGWMKVAELDMADNSNQCPSTLTQRIDSNKRICAINSNSASCAPVKSYLLY